jgi:type IV pilus assembly protein PilY1
MSMTDYRPLFRRLFQAVVCVPWLWFAPVAEAMQDPLVGYEDIDLFVASTAPRDIPNVLFILDNSANWAATNGAASCRNYADGTPGPSINAEVDKKVGLEKCALVNTLLSLPTNPDGSAKFRIAFMYMNASGSANEGQVNGAYPRMNFTELTEATRTAIVNVIKNTSAASDADQSTNSDIARSLWEAYLWYSGGSPLYGKAQTSPARDRWDRCAFGVVSVDGTCNGAGNYRSPASGNCAKNYVIFIANGSPQSAEAEIQPLIGSPRQIDYVTRPPNSYVSSNDANNWADETARFLNGVDVSNSQGTQNIITYTIMVSSATPSTSETKTNNFIHEIGVRGGGGSFLATSVDDIRNAIDTALNQIQAANSVFASASLPVSVNSQGNYLNQVFMGMFRPDEHALPRWSGNLKQYQFNYNAGSGRISLVDANLAAAINPATGFISPNALSFWTKAFPYTDFWKNKTFPAGEPNVGGASDSPDGQLVEKGGAGQQLREQLMTSQAEAARNVYTSSGPNLTSFTTALAPTSFGTGTTNAQRDDIVNWTRGTDNRSPSDEQGPGSVTLQPSAGAASSAVAATVRPAVHGDVVHSSPVVLNYGGNIGTVVFYGGNDGMLHAVRGTKTGTGGGQELWSFVPEEFLPKLKRLRDNSPPIQYATSDMTVTPTPQRKDYGVDGPITFYQKGSSAGTTQAIIYVGLRRGGRALYAFDVTNPASPTLLWKKTATGQLSALGQTWSEARVTRIYGYANPVIVMGGGYDPVEDTAANPGTITMGNIIIVLDALDGSLLRVFPSGNDASISRPVAASVTLIDMDGNGMMDRAYAVDVGGSVYRMTFPDATPAHWTISKIADFSTSTAAGQKMFYAPAVNVTERIVAVQVGTGDREKPLQKTGTLNRFFTVLDKNDGHTAALGDLTQMTSAGLDTIPADSYGCYYNLPNAGEKVVNGVVYVGGYSFFATNGPPDSTNTCTNNLGIARAYAIPAVCGPVTATTLVGGGFPPTPVTGSVLIPATGASGTDSESCEAHPENCRTVPFCVGACTPFDCDGNPGSVTALGGSNVYACPPPQRLRRSWSIRNPR